MEILTYNDFKAGKLQSQVNKVIRFLKKGDFKSADVKKLVGHDYYRAKLDKASRLLFKIGIYNGEKYILLLEVIPHHAYDKSRFLRGAAIKENNFTSIKSDKELKTQDLSTLAYVNPKNKNFHLLNKIICMDEEQNNVFALPTPLVVIGSAGSGKTAITLEKMKYLRGNIAYISLSKYLVESAQKNYYAYNYDNEKQAIDFLSFKDYVESIALPKGREVVFKDFDRWYSRYRQAFKFREPYKLFEEFKGVLTGSILDKPYLSRTDYTGLGVKQSIFLKSEREKVYDLFEKYLAFLKEQQFYDLNMVAHTLLTKVEPYYDFVVIDEVQDLTNVQLMLILKSLQTPTNFMLSGDSNQIVHPNFFSWSKLKTMFFQTDMKGSIMRILKTNYRNSAIINDLSNNLLRIKNARFGSIDKESTYLIDTVSKTKGQVNFFEDNDKLKKQLNDRTQNSTKYAVLVMNGEDKGQVRKYFKTPLLFSIQEAKGLEYENIILVNFISNNDKYFREITNGVTPEDLEGELKFSRTKDKTNKELEAYKFYINSLYVAFTRAVKNIYIVETNKKHKLLELLSITETQKKVQLEKQQSNTDEWLAEADRLEAQGKLEQAEQIRARIRGVEFISHEEAERLKPLALNTANPDKNAQKRLLKYIELHTDIDLLNELANINYMPAIAFRRTLRSELKKYANSCRINRTKDIDKYTKKYHTNVKTFDKGMTGLMIAVYYGSMQSFRHLIKKKVDLSITDEEGLTSLQLAIRGYDREKLNDRQIQEIYPTLKTPFIRCKTTERSIKISEKSMEYFLVNYLLAVRGDIISPNDPPSQQGLTMDEFIEYIELMPDNILPAYRRKRQYVNSILANNEVNRDFKYNKKLFKRVSRGCYNLNGQLSVEYV